MSTTHKALSDHIQSALEEAQYDITFIDRAMIDGWREDAQTLEHRLSNPRGHSSDCAVHNEPAYPNGPCDCGAGVIGDCVGELRNVILLIEASCDPHQLATDIIAASLRIKEVLRKLATPKP